jgi:hypothetical protein
VITPALTCSRFFYQEEEIILSICNYCLEVVAESNNERELDRCERQHECAARKTEAFAA